MESLLLPGYLFAVLGLILMTLLAWACAGLVRNIMAAFQLRNQQMLRTGDIVILDGLRGRVLRMGWLHTLLRTDQGELALLPNRLLVETPLRLVQKREEEGSPDQDTTSIRDLPEDDTALEIEYDDLDPEASIEELKAAHARTRAQIADLADAPVDVDPVQIKNRKTTLIRRLGRIEAIIDDRSPS
jgi:hypothetical protein